MRAQVKKLERELKDNFVPNFQEKISMFSF